MKRALLLTGLVLCGAQAAIADDFTFCTVCHGAEGNGNVAINAPKIAGM
jgi:cytochrome c553